MLRTVLAVLVIATAAPHARAADPWEGGGYDDDAAQGSTTP
jgi:hypothetical protein